MIIKSIKIRNFRNIARAELEFCDGVNVLYGDNARGKTNILEAVALCVGGRSFRGAKRDQFLPYYGSPNASDFGEQLLAFSLPEGGRAVYNINDVHDLELFGKLRDEGRLPGAAVSDDTADVPVSAAPAVRIELVVRLDDTSSDKTITYEYRKGERVKFSINGIPVKDIESIYGDLKYVIFLPEHLATLRGAPELRRAYLDKSAEMLYRGHRKTAVEYQTAFGQCMRLLNTQCRACPQRKCSPASAFTAGMYSDAHSTGKYGNPVANVGMAGEYVDNPGGAGMSGAANAGGRLGNECRAVMSSYLDQLARQGINLTYGRLKFLNHIDKFGMAADLYSAMAGGTEELGIAYKCNLLGELIPEKFFARLRDNKESVFYDYRVALSDLDLFYYRLRGAHRDDVVFTINDLDAREYASQGQLRSIMFVLKLAEARVIEGVCGERPVILLDEVLSELDARRRRIVLNNFCNTTGALERQMIITTCNKGDFDDMDGVGGMDGEVKMFEI